MRPLRDARSPAPTSTSDVDDGEALDGEQQEQRREHEADLDDAAEDEVDAAAERGGEPTARPSEHVERDGERADDERDARAVDQARGDVAAAIVGAEPVRARRRRQHVR